MRFLVLDDSGKPEATHPSRVLAFGGFTIEQANWHAVVRQVTGAKAAYFPRRGHPNEWEIKSRDFLTPNAWNRATNRRFCHEVVDILRRNGCSVYAVHCRKANARKPLHQEWIIPRCFQVLAAKFACELTSIAPTKGGLITCDWSTYHMDRHVSDCVQTFVLAHQITTIVGGVTYGSSRSLVTIQVADLIAGAFRIYNEGGAHLLHLVQDLNSLEWQRIGEVDVMRYPARSVLQPYKSKGRLPGPCARKKHFVCIRPKPTRRVPCLPSLPAETSPSMVLYGNHRRFAYLSVLGQGSSTLVSSSTKSSGGCPQQGQTRDNM